MEKTFKSIRKTDAEGNNTLSEEMIEQLKTFNINNSNQFDVQAIETIVNAAIKNTEAKLNFELEMAKIEKAAYEKQLEVQENIERRNAELKEKSKVIDAISSTVMLVTMIAGPTIMITTGLLTERDVQMERLKQGLVD